MQEYRCFMPDCGKLLFKADIIEAKIEIPCRSCGTTNNIAVMAKQHRAEGRESKVNGTEKKEKLTQ